MSVSSIVPSNATQAPGDTISIAIDMDMQGVNPPNNLLGSFSGKLNWDANILAYISDSGILNGFTGIANRDSTANGILIFNGANAQGKGGQFNLLQIDFKVIGPANSSTILDLGFSAMAAIATFEDILPVLTVNGGEVSTSTTGVNGGRDEELQPSRFQLFWNVPNPFNPETRIEFNIPGTSHVRLDIFNVQGQLVRTLVDEVKQGGSHPIIWNGLFGDGTHAPSGVYFYHMQTAGFVQSRKMLVLK